ncbi:MAG: hypothetical protein A2V93_03455 [Ignavibacteria bacterium RBG_16_34_14]|nr:MAG: hypothetical protein A2V93_03455 [Ignavibacteria bacterium RBG_16_34_14]
MTILNRTINGLLMIVSYFMIIRYKKVNEELKILYKENETHLMEIHHRVKNNLQIISSMIGIAMHEMEDQKTKDILQTIRQRINSMSLIHDKLSSKNIGSVSTKDFIEDLVEKIFTGFEHNGKNIRNKIDINDIPLAVETCLNLGMIINEVVYNSLKHAFRDRENGILEVKLKVTEGKVYLIIKDDGIGFKEEAEQKRKGLGLLIIEDLVGKLQGQYQFSNENGTMFSLSFSYS